jgi:hypothetical protein
MDPRTQIRPRHCLGPIIRSCLIFVFSAQMQHHLNHCGQREDRLWVGQCDRGQGSHQVYTVQPLASWPKVRPHNSKKSPDKKIEGSRTGFLLRQVHFLQCSGSGIQYFFDPGCKKSRSGIWDEHTDLIFENLFSIFWVKILKFWDPDPDQASGILSTLDPGSGMEKIGSGIRDKHPGSSTQIFYSLFLIRLLFLSSFVCHTYSYRYSTY